MRQTRRPTTISLQMLDKMARTLAPHELAQLPLHRLPPHIPAELLRRAPPANRDVLHDLLVELEAKRTHAHVEDLHHFGQEIAGALQKAESPHSVKHGDALGARLHELTAVLAAVDGADSAAPGEPGALRLPVLREQVEALHAEVGALREELAAFNQAEHVLLRKAGKAGVQRTRIAGAVARLREKTAPARAQLSQYDSLRLSVCHREMQTLKREVEAAQGMQQELGERIDALRAELQARQTVWRKALARYRSGDDYAELQSQITRLVAEQRAVEVIVPEESLQRWLDAIVDASLDRASHKLCASRLPVTRSLLYWLMTQYCQQQESSARQIARNPFVQVNAEQAIQYLLLSEQFLLDYFMRRRAENPFWFTSAVEQRRDALDEMLRELLRELERNLQAFRR